MTKKITLILFLTSFLSCRQDIKQDNSFFIGEWMSDSLVNKKEPQWREFLFFDREGKFVRTTWWNSNYILTSNAHLDDLTIKDNKGNLFSVSILDSVTIELKNDDYYGRFRNLRWPRTFDTANLSSFRAGQKNKELLTGFWCFKKFTIPDTGQNTSYEANYVRHFNPKDFLHHQIDTSLKLRFTTSNKLFISSIKDTSEYNIIVDKDKVQLAPVGQDYVMNWKYIFKNREIIIDAPTNAIQTLWTFEKR